MRLLVDNVWPDVRKLAAGRKRQLAAVAYFTSERSLSFGPGDLLIVDATDEQITSGGTSAKAIARACANKATVYSLAGLHAKLFVLGDNVIVGSANLTENSERLTEAALVSDSPQLRAEAINWIEQLRKRERAILVDRLFLKRILALKVIRSPWTAGSRSKLSLLEAVRADDPLLTDFTFRAWSKESDITNKAIKSAIKSHGKLPMLPETYTFFEDEWRPAERKMVDKLKHRYLISFEGKGVEGEELKRFVRLDTGAHSFMYPLKIDGSLVSLFDAGKPCPFGLTGADAKELCALMNAGLKARPKLRALISRVPQWDFTTETLRALVAAGESSAR